MSFSVRRNAKSPNTNPMIPNTSTASFPPESYKVTATLYIRNRNNWSMHMGESASMGDLACSQSIDVILIPTGRMALTHWRLRANLLWATERTFCKFEEPFATHLRLKLPTSTLARLRSNFFLHPLQREEMLRSIDKRIIFIRKPSCAL